MSEAGKMAAEAFAKMLENAVFTFQHRCCLNCVYWNQGREICHKYNATPPAKVIVYSCKEGWEQDDIPF